MNAFEQANFTLALHHFEKARELMERRAEEAEPIERDLIAADAYSHMLTARGFLFAMKQLNEMEQTIAEAETEPPPSGERRTA